MAVPILIAIAVVVWLVVSAFALVGIQKRNDRDRRRFG